ncbi:uncharacterized protein [Centruroides vittatus]|uniref:uncharacterized protein n=1 Tax=Centruroides vittatus TaxID=120091 RepID=UPI00350F668E
MVTLYYKVWQLKWGNRINYNNHNIEYEDFEANVDFAKSRHPATPNSITFDIPAATDLIIFTDGSRSDLGVGCGFVSYKDGQETAFRQFKLGEHCTTFQAELLAINRAIKWTDEQHRNKCINIITDSASAMTLLQGRSLHPLAVNTHEIANGSTNRYSINWTRAHQGTQGNERADAIAKQASTNSALPIEYSKISLKIVKNILWKEMGASWQSEWEDNNSTTNNFIPNLKDFHSYDSYSPNHNLTQFLTNHGRFFSYLDRFKNTTSPNCTICGISDGNTTICCTVRCWNRSGCSSA